MFWGRSVAPRPKKVPSRDAEGLTLRQARFVDLLLADSEANASRAYVGAGFRAKNPKVASAGAARLLADVSIQGSLARRRAKTVAALDISREQLIRRLLEISDLDLGDILTEGGSLKGVKEWPEALRRSVQGLEVVVMGGEDGGVIHKVKLGDRGQNLERVARMLGLIVDKSDARNTSLDLAAVTEALKDRYTPDQLMTLLDRLLGRERGGKAA